jgi:hypothetical protein
VSESVLACASAMHLRATTHRRLLFLRTASQSLRANIL